MNGHRRIEERSLSLHRAVAEKLRNDAAVLAQARARVERWRRDKSVHPHYAEAWFQVLLSEPEEVAQRLMDPGETMCALRQCSPFAGALTPQERWQILQQTPEARG